VIQYGTCYHSGAVLVAQTAIPYASLPFFTFISKFVRKPMLLLQCTVFSCVFSIWHLFSPYLFCHLLKRLSDGCVSMFGHCMSVLRVWYNFLPFKLPVVSNDFMKHTHTHTIKICRHQLNSALPGYLAFSILTSSSRIRHSKHWQYGVRAL